MESIIIYLFLRRIFKSVSKSPRIVLANNNLNWVDVPEEEKPLPPLETATFQQLSQLINLLAEALGKFTANLTSTTNSVPSIARTQMLNTFDSINSEKINSFLFQYQLYFCANPVQFIIYVVKVNFVMNLSNRSHIELVWDWVGSRRARSLLSGVQYEVHIWY